MILYFHKSYYYMQYLKARCFYLKTLNTIKVWLLKKLDNLSRTTVFTKVNLFQIFEL